MGFGGGGGGGGNVGNGNLDIQMQAALQAMGLMPQMGDVFGGRGFGSTYDPATGLWGSAAPPIAGQANVGALMQAMAAPKVQQTPRRSLWDSGGNTRRYGDPSYGAGGHMR